VKRQWTGEGNHFEIEELNTPREGLHSKDDRISRLEPDFNRGIFYLPASIKRTASTQPMRDRHRAPGSSRRDGLPVL
jgi:hypothetical protein